MSILPVIIRELRAQARQPLTHWLRMVGGVSVVGALVAALWTIGGISGQATAAYGSPPWMRSTPAANTVQAFGTTLFSKMNFFIFLAIWLFVPLATADAVSRERREGTLAILYLTKLGSFGIVVGKSFVHMLRAFSLFLTMAPWLMLPLVFGGVELRDLAMALMLDFTAVLLAQAAGLLASTIPRDWLKSVILAESFALILLLAMLNLHGAVLGKAVRAGIPGGLTPGTPAFWNSGFATLWNFFDQQNYQPGMIARTSRLLELTANGSFRSREPQYAFGRTSADSDWQQLWTSLTAAGHKAWFLGVAGMVLGAGFVLLAATGIGAWRVEKSWQDTPADIHVLELRRRYLAPRFRVQTMQRKFARALTANPVGWLQHYSPSARLVKWGWCLAIIVVEIIFSANSDDLYAAQAGLGLVLLLGLTFSATGSFREELETGAFELLLVTPLLERQIIVGRLRGLWRQFFPAMLVYGAGSIYLASGWRDHALANEAWLSLGRTTIGFCSLPVIGLYFSVKRWNFFAAWLAACMVGLIPAWLGRTLGIPLVPLWSMQLIVALAAGMLLERRLLKREFVLRQN